MQPPIVVIFKEREEKLGSEVIGGLRSDLQKRRKEKREIAHFPLTQIQTLFNLEKKRSD